MQNSIIGTLCEKAIEKQLRGAPSIKYLNIAERLKCLKQYNRRNSNDEDGDDDPSPTPIFDPPPYYPSSQSKVDSDIKDDLSLTQKFLLGDRPRKEKIAVAVGEKDTAATGEKELDFRKILADYFQKLIVFLIMKKLILVTTFLK